MILRATRNFLEMIKFSHSLFALPFALCGAWLAAGGVPAWQKLLGILGAMVGARSAAMGFNRLVDRKFDADNPRTRDRALPAGKISSSAAIGFIVLNALLFFACSWYLGAACLMLSPLVLAVLFFYSFTKRWTSVSHIVLGFCLALSPLGAWLAVRGDFSGDLRIPISLGAAVLLWVAGFDLIYACQDVDFDRRSGLHSIPARYGVKVALILSALFHAVVIAILILVGMLASLGIAYQIGILVAAVLLFFQHWVVRPNDLSRVNLAFFTLNGWVSLGLFIAVAVDFALKQGSVS